MCKSLKISTVFLTLKLLAVYLAVFSVQAVAAGDSPVWPTSLETPDKNPCVECKCPEIMDDGKYAVEQILSPTRGYHYSELFLKCPGSDTAGIWNTTLYNHQAANSRDSIPKALFQNYSDEQAAKEYGAVKVWMEPTRVWTHDRFRVYRGTTVRNFAGLDTAWGAYLPASILTKEVPTYKPTAVIRNSTFWYDAGKPIWVLDGTDGNTYINQSVTDVSGGYEGLDTLGERLAKLPKGWKFRKVILGDTPLTINGIKADDGRESVWIVIQDEFHNSYSACWKNAAGESSCNFDP